MELQLTEVLGHTDNIRALGIQGFDEQLSVEMNSRKYKEPKALKPQVLSFPSSP